MLTKILAIGTLILSVIYFGVTATLFSYRVNYKALFEKEQQQHEITKKELQEEIEKMKKDSENWQMQFIQADSERQALKDRVQSLSDQLRKNEEAFKSLSKDYASLNQSYLGLNESFKKLEAKQQELESKFQAEQSQRIKFESLYSQELEKNLALSERQGQIEQENAELSRMLVDRTKETEDLKEKLQKVKELEIPIPEIAIKKKSIDGIVTAVSSKVNLILISVGQEQDVEVGDQFVVYRKDKYIGKIIIEKVWRDGAAGRSIKEVEKDKIQQGDRVTTRIF